MKIHRNIIEQISSSFIQIVIDGRYADKVIQTAFQNNKKWGARDRKIFAESLYDMVRHKVFIKYCGNLDEPIQNQEAEKYFYVYYFLFKEEILPGYSIDSETLNGRKKEAESIREILYSIPKWLDDYGVEQLGEEKWSKEIKILNEVAPVFLRTNTLKITSQNLISEMNKEGIICEKVGEYDESLALPYRKNVFQTECFTKGFFEVQDLSSQKVSRVLDPQPGMRVVDACAGAGGKSLHIASLMQNRGRIIAMDIEQSKLDELKRRAKRNGIDIIETRLIDSSKIIKRMNNSADMLLIDAPCSGSGVLKRNPDAKYKLTINRIKELVEIQKRILETYPQMLKTDGFLVYATCSIFPEENENQVQFLIKNNPGNYELVNQITIFPSESEGDGFFIAKLKKLV